jgi:hypothetical protein
MTLVCLDRARVCALCTFCASQGNRKAGSRHALPTTPASAPPAGLWRKTQESASREFEFLVRVD